MRLSIFIFAYLLSFISPIASAQDQSGKEMIYAGSFSVRDSKGIYVFQFDRAQGKLTEIQTVSEGKDPSFIAIHPDGKFLYAIYDKGTIGETRYGSVMSFKIDPSTGSIEKLNERSAMGRGPAHISIDPKGRFAYVSNYGSGTLAVYPINMDGSLAKPTEFIHDHGKGPHPHQKGPHVHAVIPSPDGKFVYVCDLGIDKVFIYKVTSTGKLTPAAMPYFKCLAGSGPRQFAISPDGKYAFLVEELISRLVSFRRDRRSGALVPLEHFDMLPEGFEESGSDATVFVSPDGNFVYATNWGPKGLTGYKLNNKTGVMKQIDQVNTQGLHPRDICIDRKGAYIFVANMGSDNLTIFKRDPITGQLQFTGEKVNVPAISCIKQLFLH